MAMQVGNLLEGEPTSEINTTPLIDVMLVLLIMLIVTLPPKRHAVKLDTPLPCPTCVKNDDIAAPIRVIVDFDGAIYWNGEAVTRATLAQRFAAEARRDNPAEVHIEPHRLTKYGVVAHVMSSAQREGIRRMGVIDGGQGIE